jgi:amino acid adenylation domain-containing protein
LLHHEYAPLALAQRCSGVAAPAPLFSALLNYRHDTMANTTEAGSELTLPAWEGIEVLSSEARTNYPLILSVDDCGRGFGLNVQVQSPIDPERICAYMNTALEQLVEALEQRPTTPVGSLDMLPGWERVQLLEEWNDTQAEYLREQCVHTLYELQAGRTPETVAVVFGSEHVSYGELERRANRLANHLRAVGVYIESRVGVCVERSVEMVETVLGVLKAGGACVPLDPAYPVERLTHLVRDGGVEWVVTIGETGERLLEGSEVKFLQLDLDPESMEAEAMTSPRVAVDPDNLLYVIYTSGSTGKPKGVALTHAALVNLICWDGTTLRPQSRMLQFSSLNFDASFHELFLTWASGGTIVLITREQQRDPYLLSKEILDNSVERLNLPAAIIDGVLEELAVVGCDSVRELISTAEQMQIGRRWWERLEQVGCAVWNHYGPSESHVITAWQAWNGGLGNQEHPPIGKPIANCRTYVLNKGLQAVPVGAVGELYLGGMGIARGYLNRPEETAERFVPDPHSRRAGERLYHTGDMAQYLEDGNIEYLGRIDHQVKIRGYRVELGEVEVALRQQPGIADAVVVMQESRSGDKRLSAYVVAEPGESAKIDGLRSALRERLPDYMIPSEWVEMERFPLTSNGKVDRRALPAPQSRAVRNGSAPCTPVEEIVAGIWREVLKLEKVGAEESFFELGGQSLLATRVVSRVRKMIGVEIGVRSIFEEQTVRGIARRIEEGLRAGKKIEAPLLVRVSREGRLPLSYAQQRLWFIDRLDPGNAIYNILEARRLKGSLNLEVLERVINEIVRRHEVLRTRIEVEAGEPAQVIDVWEPRSLDVVDMRRWPQDEREAEVRERIREEAETGFDLRRGPLLRVKVLKLEEEDQMVLYTMHHIVSDEWSIGILMREVEALYQAYLAGDPSPLEELDIQYADYAKWQRQCIQEEVINGQLEYWRKHLGGELPVLKLITERSQLGERTHRARHQFVALPPELTRQIVSLSRNEGVTLFMTLLAAFKVLLSRYSGQEDIIVGTGIANRNSIELERLIGFFVNTLPLRTNLAGDPTFRELLARVREVVLKAYAHQDVPFEKLVDELQPERSLNQTPLFRAVFTIRDAPISIAHLPEWMSTPVASESGTAKFDLIMSMMETSQGLIGNLQYDADLFDDTGIQKMLVHFRTLLESIVEGADQPLSTLRLMRYLESESLRSWDFPGLPLNQRDLENILIEIDSTADL